MLDKFYRIFMALRNNKIICISRSYIATVNIKTSAFSLWYMDELRLPVLFDSCSTKDDLMFKWNILMSRGEG